MAPTKTERADRNMDEQMRNDSEISSWKLVPLEGPPAESRDDGEEEDTGTASRPAKILNPMFKYLSKNPVDSQQSFNDFTNEHYQDVRAYIEGEMKGSVTGGTLLHEVLKRHLEKTTWKVVVKLILDVDTLVTQTFKAAPHSIGANTPKFAEQSILRRTDQVGDTCLHKAIQSGDEEEGSQFIRFLCTAAQPEDLRMAIGTVNSRDQSCIHLAIASLRANGESKLDQFVRPHNLSILEQLVAHADQAVLSKPHKFKTGDNADGIDNLPLHDLVHISLSKGFSRTCVRPEAACVPCQTIKSTFAKYRDTYLRIIDIVIKAYPEALRKLNKLNLSPFLFHCNTRSEDSNTKGWRAPDYSGITHSAKPVPVNGQGKEPALQVGQTSSTKETGGKCGTTKDSGGKHTKPKFGTSESLANQVFRKLLAPSVSQETFPDTCDALFGKRFPSSELIFKAAPLTPKTMTLHQKLPLEPMLACVELGLDDRTNTAATMDGAGRAQRTLIQQDRKAREDRVKKLFHWLRKREVKRIVRLVVYDNPEMPCRDHVIRDCLKGFDIRYLDWDKEDMSIDVIKDAAPNVRELWLSWSGRNSALLGWCNERDGLRMLKGSLRKLYVSVSGEWENAETNQTNRDNFTASLKERTNMPQLVVHDGDRVASGVEDNSLGHEAPGAKNGSIWLEAVQMFSRALSTRLGPEKIQDMNGAVRVAIIDDGVDLEHLATTDYITGGWYPDRRAPDRGDMNVWYLSETHHGTQMAKLIQMVWPYLNLYVAKLDTSRRVYNSVAESAAVAIRKAIDNNANVISMSWTIYHHETAETNDKGLSDMKAAMEEAAKRDILMFCAAQDSGYSSYRKPYPATECDPRAVKRVGSAGIYGERCEYVHPTEVDYLLPGEIALSSDSKISGSSAATALASGLAGLILWCFTLQEREMEVANGAKRPSKANNAPHSDREPDASLQRANSKLTSRKATGDTNGPSKGSDANFQKHKVMYGLFDSLCGKTNNNKASNPFVNATPLLHQAAKDQDPVSRLMKLCKERVRDVVRDTP